MDVTTDNFKEILEDFDKVIESATFFSIDSEFTGLFSERTVPFCSPSEFYKKLRQGTDEYIIVQIGITAFQIDNENPNKFTYKSFNFYVYPQGRDENFRCSASNVTFLAGQNFDFNKLFGKGLSCCTQEMAKKLRDNFDERQKAREEALEANDERSPNDDDVPIPLEELDKLEEVRTKLKTFLESDESKSEKNLVFGNCNAFQRKLMYQIIHKEFHDKVTATSKQVNNQKAIVVERKWSSERQQIECEKQNENDENEYQRLVGLSLLLMKLSQSKKLIIGHNMFMDLFYLIRQFFEPLPQSLKTFKKQAHKIFPNILDTKHLCNSKFRTEITSSALAHVYEAVSRPPFKLPEIKPVAPEYGYESVKEHEAGYDSYITGVCFLGLVKQLNMKYSDISTKSVQLRNFLNKIFVMRLTDIYYIDLMGPEPQPNRDHVFHIIFPEKWTQSDIINHFRKYGPVFIRWIDSTSAFVSLLNRENAPILLKTVTATKGVKLSTFSTYLRVTAVDSEDEEEEDGADTSGGKRAIVEPSNERWICILVVVAIILIILFLIVPDIVKLLEEMNFENLRPAKQAKLMESQTKDDAKQKITEFVKPDEWPTETF